MKNPWLTYFILISSPILNAVWCLVAIVCMHSILGLWPTAIGSTVVFLYAWFIKWYSVQILNEELK